MPTTSLREITADTVRKVTSLAVRSDQKHFVAPNAVSLAEALFWPEAWYRAIYADDALAGFVMLYDESLRPQPPAQPRVGVWRLMIDERFQGQGIGKSALLQVIEHVRSKRVCTSLELSYVPGPGSPEGFYLGLGFRPNGKIDDGEVVLELPLDMDPALTRPEGSGLTSEEAAIRTVIDQWARATREGRHDDVLANHLDDLVIFDVLPPMQYTSASAYRASWESWQPDTQGDMQFELADLSVRAGGNVGFAFGLLHCGGTLPNGQSFNDVVRITFCLTRQAGQWKVAHQHVSKPIGQG